jgi:hypothetical integral membrane protein (TIGR02206 family)
MATDFVLFGPLHLAILTAIPGATYLSARALREEPPKARRVANLVGVALAINELIWYVFRYSHEGWRFPEGLPLQLCDLTLWLAVVAGLTFNRWAYEMAFFAGIAGAGMALLTPDLWAPTFSYPSLYFFLVHGGIVAIPLFLTWSRLLRPERGCLWRVLIVLNAYALVVGTFNWIFGTNYVYLCRKPAGASALDYFGPWPIYILAGEAFAMFLFLLLWLPFRRRRETLIRTEAWQ